MTTTTVKEQSLRKDPAVLPGFLQWPKPLLLPGLCKTVPLFVTRFPLKPFIWSNVISLSSLHSSERLPLAPDLLRTLALCWQLIFLLSHHSTYLLIPREITACMKAETGMACLPVYL